MARQLPILPTYSADLVPDVIVRVLEKYIETPGNLLNLLNFRLISPSWNITIQSAIPNRCKCVVTDCNINRFVDLLSTSTSLRLGESNIKSIILNLGADYESALQKFAQLPKFFLANLWELEVTFTVDRTPTFSRFLEFLFQLGEMDLLEELTLKLDRLEEPEEMYRQHFFIEHNLDVLPVEPGIMPLFGRPDFSNLTTLTAPLHVSVNLLKCCSSCVLKNLTLLAYFIGVESGFWKEFKNAVVLNGHAETLTEFFIINKSPSEAWLGFDESWLEDIWECNLTLRKLGLGIQYAYRETDLVNLLTQQASTLEYLSIPRLRVFPSYPHFREGELEAHALILENNIHFPRLQELHYDWFHPESGRMFPHFPSLTTLGLNIKPEFTVFPIPPVRNFLEHCVSQNIRNVIVKDMDRYFPVFQIFPEMQRLTVSEEIRDVLIIKDIFAYGTNLKALSIKFNFDIMQKHVLGTEVVSHRLHEFERWVLQCSSYCKPPDYTMEDDCFLVGLNPEICNQYQTGTRPCNARTEFEQRNRQLPSLRKLQNLEFLSLEGHFTELTVWAGIKELTRLTEIHLKSQYLMHPLTLIELEDYLPLLKYWSYTKLAQKTLRVSKSKEVYKYFRYLPNSYASDQVQFWKFMDDKICKTEQRIIKITEFAALDLNYTSLYTTPPDEYSFSVPYDFDASEKYFSLCPKMKTTPSKLVTTSNYGSKCK